MVSKRHHLLVFRKSFIEDLFIIILNCYFPIFLQCRPESFLQTYLQRKIAYIAVLSQSYIFLIHDQFKFISLYLSKWIYLCEVLMSGSLHINKYPVSLHWLKLLMLQLIFRMAGNKKKTCKQTDAQILKRREQKRESMRKARLKIKENPLLEE